MPLNVVPRVARYTGDPRTLRSFFRSSVEKDTRDCEKCVHSAPKPLSLLYGHLLLP